MSLSSMLIQIPRFATSVLIGAVMIGCASTTVVPTGKESAHSEISLYRDGSFFGSGATLHFHLSGENVRDRMIEVTLAPGSEHRLVLAPGSYRLEKFKSSLLGLPNPIPARHSIAFQVNPGEVLRIGSGFGTPFSFERYDLQARLLNRDPAYKAAPSLAAKSSSTVQSSLPKCSNPQYRAGCWDSVNLPGGHQYTGEFRDNRFNGWGTYTLANGNNYVGDFKDGRLGSQGTYTFADGNKYVGEFRDDKRHGQGIHIFADGRPSAEGIWENDKFIRAERIPDSIAGRTPSTLPAQISPRAPEPARSNLVLSALVSAPDPNGAVVLNITTGADTASLRINGDEEGGRADGRYSVTRFARIGSNQFEIIATDRFGISQRKVISVNRQASDSTVQFSQLNPLNVRPRPPRDAVAIIIGIQDYRRVPKADFANNDARVFYDYAVRGLGIRGENIKMLLDQEADEVGILSALKNWLPLKVKKNQTEVFVFYSGHGLPSNDGASLFLLPHGVDRQFLERTAINQTELVAALQSPQPRSVTLFLDACYSGQTRAGEMLLASARPIVVQAKASSFPANFTVISASAPEELASSSPELKHGIFSYWLMKGMEGEADINKDGQITAAELREYLSDSVGRMSAAQGRLQRPQAAGELNRVVVQR